MDITFVDDESDDKNADKGILDKGDIIDPLAWDLINWTARRWSWTLCAINTSTN